MIPEKHRGDTVKAKAVKLIFVEPEAAVGKKKMNDARLAVVEAAAIPCAVPSLGARMKILPRSAIETSYTVALVFDSMRVDYIHNDAKPHAVRCINERL